MRLIRNNSPVEDAMPERLPQAKLTMTGESWGLDQTKTHKNKFRRKTKTKMIGDQKVKAQICKLEIDLSPI